MFIGNNIKYREAIIKYGMPSGLFKDEKGLLQFIRDFQPWHDPDTKAINEDHVHFAVNLKEIKAVYKRCLQHNSNPNVKTKLDWKGEISDALNRPNYIIDMLSEYNFDEDVYSPALMLSNAAKRQINGENKGTLQVVQTSSTAPRKQGKELEPVGKGYVKGGTIRVYCSHKDCRRALTEQYTCKHSLEVKKYQLRIYIPGFTGEQGKKEFLKARYKGEAVAEAAKKIEKYIESGYNNTTEEPKQTTISKIEYLSQAIEAYNKERERRQGTLFTKNICTPHHIKEMVRMYNILEAGLKGQGYHRYRLTEFNNRDKATVLFDELYTWLVAQVYTKEDAKAKKMPAKKKVGDRKYSNGYINKMTRIWSSLINWLNDDHNMQLRNPFKKGRKLAHKPQRKVIDDDQLFEFIKWLGTNPNVPRHPQQKVAPRDFAWMQQVLFLQYFFGGRREDAIMLKWSDVKVNKGLYFLHLVNWKSGRIKKDDELEVTPMHINDEVMQFFTLWGIEEHIGKDEYIILPEYIQTGKKQSRSNLIAKITIGFTFFGKVCFGETFDATNCAVRHTCLTNVYDVSENDEAALKKSRHKQISTLLKYYVNPEMLALKRAQKYTKAA